MLRGALVFALTVLLLPASSSAQPADPTRDAEARQHFLAGRDAFSRGDFSTAGTEFERAYALSRRAQLLYNIGRAYQEQLRLEDASRAFQHYLDAVPDAPDREEVQGRLRIIEVAMSHAQPTPPTPPAVTPRPVTAPPPESRPWRVAFWVGGGLTLVTGGATVALGLLADQQYQSLLQDCAPGCPESSVNDMRLRSGLVNGGIVTTSVLFAGTITAFILDRTQRRPPPTGVLPPVAAIVPARGGAALVVAGAF